MTVEQLYDYAQWLQEAQKNAQRSRGFRDYRLVADPEAELRQTLDRLQELGAMPRPKD